MFIKQLYKPKGSIPFYIKIRRIISKIVIKIIFFIFKDGALRNSLLQLLKSYIEIKVNDNVLKFKDGNERLYLFLKVQFIVQKDLVNWIDTFNNKDIFYDIGSNIGMFSIYAAKKKIKTYCFEPHYSNLDDLQHNIYLNKVEDYINVVPLPLNETVKKVSIDLRDLTSSSARNEISHLKSDYNNELKSVLRLNTISFSIKHLIQNNLILPPTKVKLDVDGVEFLILKGFEDLLSNVDEILLELYEKDYDYWKYFKEYKNKKSINTQELTNNYFLNNNYKKNPYHDEIINLLKDFKFNKFSEYGNNLLFKKS